MITLYRGELLGYKPTKEVGMGSVGFAFLLTVIAGLSTGVGGLMAFFSKGTNGKFLALSLGFSAGVMIYVSFVELFASSIETLGGLYGLKSGTTFAVLSFFCGIFIIAVIDKLIPDKANPHEAKTLVPPALEGTSDDNVKNLKRTGVFTALAIAIHNFPEGLATFVSALQDISVALPIVAAIAIHNIPEGIAVSVPIYYATGSKKKALLYSVLSGFAEPLGALVGYLILMPFLNDIMFGVLYALVAGIMVFISIDELLPSARAYGEHHLSIYGLVAGMAVMAFSMILFI